jgi:hypothetical protein
VKALAKTCEIMHNTAGPIETVDLSALVHVWKALLRCDPAAAQAIQQLIRALLAESEGDLFGDTK